MFRKWFWNTHAYACFVGFLGGCSVSSMFVGWLLQGEGLEISLFEPFQFWGMIGIAVTGLFWLHFNFFVMGDE